MSSTNSEPVKPKRAPRAKKNDKDTVSKTPKKRGRKPKGGKIVTITSPEENVVVPTPNVILHLKCGINDLKNNGFFSNKCYEYDPSDVSNKIDAYQFDEQADSSFFEHVEDNQGSHVNNITSNSNNNNSNSNNNDEKQNAMNDIITNKLKQLAHDLHNNNISDKKSACFHCTCDFDNPPIYIPKHSIEGTYHVYGCFCSPECAAGHLMKQTDVDPSSKFERYSLLNHIYCKIYNYEKNIKPAPDPHYTLDKFYGNLSIQEYRQMLKNERLLLIVDKPLTRSLPELHEDNDDFIINNKGGAGKYKLRRSSKPKSKNEILMNNFNMK
jgi:hypothetical protein